MRGGVVSKIDREPLTLKSHRILGHPLTTIDYLSRGTFGFVFKVTYNGEEPTGFVDENDNEVRLFILKVQSIDMRMKRTEDPEPEKDDEDEDEDKKIAIYSKEVDWDDVVNEVILQQKMYKCALESDLIPPCPSILFYGSITADQFETYKKGYFVYKDNEIILPRDYNSLRVSIILMEYVHAKDLTEIPHEIYVPIYQEIRDKAFRTFVTALQCGVLQRDPKPENFLLSDDGNITMIDFGAARKLYKKESSELEPLIQKAEEGNCKPLIHKLLHMDDEKYKILEKWLFRPEESLRGIRIATLTTLAPAIKLPEEIAPRCKAGICNIQSETLPKRNPISEETKAERVALERRDMELKDRKARKEAEKEELRLYRENEGKRDRFWGGKRHTKYVGTRRHKKTRTRRKV
jgi:serine/threonine protein kinase